MRVSEPVESALHLLLVLAALPLGAALVAADLAEFHALAPAQTAKVLQRLASAGILTASEGRAGGYRLAEPAEQVSVAEIVRAVEEGPAFRCHEIRQLGPCSGPPEAYTARCRIAALMDKAEAAWWQCLDDHSLADLARSVGAGIDDGIRKESSNWLTERARW
jgi:Rrf2 family protein